MFVKALFYHMINIQVYALNQSKQT